MCREDVDLAVNRVEVTAGLDFVTLGPWDRGTVGRWDLADVDLPGFLVAVIGLGRAQVIEVPMGPGDPGLEVVIFFVDPESEPAGLAHLLPGLRCDLPGI